MWANRTIGVEAERSLTSFSSHSSCSLPRLPKPPALRSTTLTRPMKCTAVGVEAVPTGALGGLAIAVAINLALIRIDQVVLARHVVHVKPRLRNDVVGVVKFFFLREVADVAGVDHKRRLLRQGINFLDRLFQGAERVGIGRLVEADMAIADLQERKTLRIRGLRFAHNPERVGHTAGNGP